MKIGFHINTHYGFLTTVDYAKQLGINFFQIFLTSPKNYNSKRHTDDELNQLRCKLLENSIGIVIHASYMLNFCNPTTSNIYKNAVKLLCQDLHESVIIGSIGVVVHLGKCLDFGVKEGTNNFVEGIKEVLSKTPIDSTIILETGAGQGSEICTSLFDLGRLYQMFTDDERKRVKFCIDTCHVFSAGYDIGHYGFVDVFDSLVETNLGWKNVVCVHLNNSKCILGSKKDRHADLTKGHIDEDGLAKFVRICNSKEIPIIMETPCEEMSKSDQLKLLKTWLTQK